jgi:dTMP kinase
MSPSRHPGPDERRPGRLIVLEGGEGSGKSTQAVLLSEALGAVLTHEPGGTPLGAALRGILLDDLHGPLADRTEALLMAADRAQHASELILPTLRGGRHVVCDRYIGSSVAYQGHGRGLDPAWVQELSVWAVDGLLPDLVVLLDVDETLAASRTGRPRDRIEAAGAAFHRRVRAGFLAQAQADPRRWVVVDGSDTVSGVQGEIARAVEQRLGLVAARR